MARAFCKRLVIASLFAGLGALTVTPPAAAQATPSPERGTQGMPGGMGPGMGMGGQGMGGPGMGMGGPGMGGMMGMMNMMQGCRQLMGAGAGLPHLPEGNEKLELQMHADMMRAMGDILGKYAARLPERK